MISPNAAKFYNGSPEYFSRLVEKTGLSQREVARRLGVGYSSLRAYMDGTRAVIYPVQFALEALAETIGKFEGKFKLSTGEALVSAEVRECQLPEAAALAEDGELPRNWDTEQFLWLCEFSINNSPAGRFFAKPSSLGLDMQDADSVLQHCLGLAKERGVI